MAAASSRSAPARRRGLAPGVELQARRFLTRVERPDFGLDFGGRDRQLLDLLAVEGDLLLEAADLHLARVRGFARRRRLAVGLHQFEAQPLERRFELGELGRGRGLALARAGELRARGFDGLRRARGTVCANCTFSQRRSSSRSRL